MSIDTNRFSNKFYWQLKVVLLSTCNYQATDYKTLIALFKATSRRLCPGVPVHRGNNHCTPFFTNLCLSVEHCWFFFIGSCEQVHEDRTVPALYAGRIWSAALLLWFRLPSTIIIRKRWLFISVLRWFQFTGYTCFSQRNHANNENNS